MIAQFSANPEQPVVYSVKQPISVVTEKGEEEQYLVHYCGSDAEKAKKMLKLVLEHKTTAYFCAEILLNQ